MHIIRFETLAAPTRQRILAALRSGEQPVNDIVRVVGIHQSSVSRHLQILHWAGFVSVRASGQSRHYTLCPQPLQEIDAWLDSYHQLWATRLDRFSAALAQKPENNDDNPKAPER